MSDPWDGYAQNLDKLGDTEAIASLRHHWPAWTAYRDTFANQCHAIHAATLVTVTAADWPELQDEMANLDRQLPDLDPTELYQSPNPSPRGMPY